MSEKGSDITQVDGLVQDAVHLPEGIYILINKASRTLLDLAGGKPSNGTKCQGWRQLYNESFASSRWVIRHDGADHSYTLTNIKSGSLLDLEAGKGENGAKVTGWNRPPESQVKSRAHQEWHIANNGEGFYTLRNAQTSTLLELDRGSPDDGTWATCSAFIDGKDSQLWDLEKVTRSGEEIISVLGDWNEPLLSRLCQPYSLEAQYLVIPEELRRQIWDRAGLRLQPLRKHIFDHDDFVVKAKEAVTTWARDNFKVDGYSVLFGLVYGQATKGSKAYNWYLTPDMHSLVFFDAQTGKEHTTAALAAKGFQPSFAVF